MIKIILSVVFICSLAIAQNFDDKTQASGEVQIPDSILTSSEFFYTGQNYDVSIGSLAATGDIVFIINSPVANTEILRLSADGNILWRGRTVESDSVLVAAFRDVIQGSRSALCGEK